MQPSRDGSPEPAIEPELIARRFTSPDVSHELTINPLLVRNIRA